MLGGNISGTHDASVVLTVGSDSTGHYVREYQSAHKQSDMDAKSFARIVEHKVRKALKTESEEGEYQQKTERSVRYSRVSASHYHTELACFKLLG